MTNPTWDNKIDDQINPILVKLDTMDDDQFIAHCNANLSMVTIKAIRMMAWEQLSVEQDPARKAKLTRLYRLI